MRIFQQADVNLVGGDGNYPFHHLLGKQPVLFLASKYSKRDLIHVLINQKANVNQENSSGACPLEVLLLMDYGYNSTYIKEYVAPLLKAGATSIGLATTGKSMFELTDKLVSSNVRNELIKSFLESDLAFQPDLEGLRGYPSWAKTWRAACNEPKWIVAKHLLEFEDSNPRPSPPALLQFAFIVVAEKLLKEHKAQLVLWQAGRLERDAARIHRQEFVAILNDCNERQAAIEPSWYTYLLQIMDFG
jgi:hypothetical protein